MPDENKVIDEVKNTENNVQQPPSINQQVNVTPVADVNDDELEKLRKENERLKEIQRLREENKRLSEGQLEPQENSATKKEQNNFIIPVAVGVVAVIIVIIVLTFGLHIFSAASTSLVPTVNAGASGAFFVGPDGASLGSTYITGLSNLGSQLAQVGAEQVAGSMQYQKPTITSQGPSPGYFVLVYGNSSSNQNYNMIPITIPSNFSNYSISTGGKPTFVYMGAQGCPFCAGMRWAIAIALSRFGNFSKLFYDRSVTNDANVPTLMFNFSQSLFNQATSQSALSGGQAPYGDGNPEPFVTGAYYTSKYINFEPIDEMGGSFLINITGINQISPLIYNNVYKNSMLGVKTTSNAVTAADGFSIKNFFVGGVPFFDINNKYTFDGATVNANTYYSSAYSANGYLNPAYQTHADILNSIEHPAGGSLGQTELGAANILTAQICTVINNTAPVCGLSYITGLEHTINSLNYSGEYQ